MTALSDTKRPQPATVFFLITSHIEFRKKKIEMTVAAKLAFFLLAILSISGQVNSDTTSKGGRWKLLRRSIGISAMHMALLSNDMIVSFDRTDSGPSNISLPKKNQNKTQDRYSHSVEFNPHNHSVRPLTILTNTWCSSGAISGDGVLIQSGGHGDGVRVVRSFSPCKDCDWVEHKNGLAVNRWYATNQILPDGSIIVLGGRNQFNYEFIPKPARSSDYTTFELPFLRETKDKWSENNLYPFVHLSTDGNLFIFANTKSILLDYINHRVVRSFPEIPGGFSRNYPSTGSSVLLPLRLDHGNSGSQAGDLEAEVLICGGSRPESNSMAMNGTFLPASNTCGRLKITDSSPEWEISAMPIERVMGDMVLLPTGDVLIINGATKGSAGWEMARDPATNPVLYRAGIKTGDVSGTYAVLRPSGIPRLYHSTAILMPDGRVLVGGSNPNKRYEFTGVMFPTELSLEAFYPPYLDATAGGRIVRPKVVTPARDGLLEVTYGQRSSVEFVVKSDHDQTVGVDQGVTVTMVAPSFTTHSFSMSQRLLVLPVDGLRRISGSYYAIDWIAPGSPVLAPPGYYLLFLVHEGVPSRGKWVRIK